MKTETFHKQERIVSRKQIETLFSGGTSQSLSAFPLRVVFMTQALSPGEAPVQILISVPKKHFKHAVDRNLVKRQVREAYRKNKQGLLQAMESHEKEGLVVSFIWLENKLHDSHSVEHHIVELLRHISERL